MALIVIASSLKDVASCAKKVTEPKHTLKLQGITYGFKKASDSALITVDSVKVASK